MYGRQSSSSMGPGLIGPGDETMLTTGGGLERGVGGQEEFGSRFEGVRGIANGGRGTLNFPLS